MESTTCFIERDGMYISGGRWLCKNTRDKTTLRVFTSQEIFFGRSLMLARQALAREYRGIVIQTFLFYISPHPDPVIYNLSLHFPLPLMQKPKTPI